ncbi:hypothetical protein EXIGLDRAFT_294671 [Exidia glandulosa HHB12029]|uniref:Uncharacterized protein n=1 Tax=Exidia glandulosa HHB12029 TaxID=1314781 RepID=A0A165DDF2_EXIGL|nr:hypothetical protein EXIGLDRAFT_294671 [Exidia glandulosa HHB12029]
MATTAPTGSMGPDNDTSTTADRATGSDGELSIPTNPTESHRSASPSSTTWPWAMIMRVMEYSDEIMSPAHKAETIYISLRRATDPSPPPHFRDDDHRWRRVIRRICRKARRKSRTLLDYIQHTVAAEFQAATEPSHPLIGKRKLDLDEDSDLDYAGSKEIVAGFRLTYATIPRDRMFVQDMALQEIPDADVGSVEKRMTKKIRHTESRRSVYVQYQSVLKDEQFRRFAPELQFRLDALFRSPVLVPLLPPWSPPESWSSYPETQHRLDKIICGLHGVVTVPPDPVPELFLYFAGKLHELDYEFSGRLEDLRKPARVVHVVGTRGSGKSRLLWA